MNQTADRTGYSRASQLLGMAIKSADPTTGVVEATFEGTEAFSNFNGHVHGGVLVAMLDDLMGYALGVSLKDVQFATANLNASFLRPAAFGTLSGRGEILTQEGDVYHLAAKLYNAAGELVAAATARAKVTSAPA